MTGEQVDSLAALAVVSLLAVSIALAARARPEFALVLWIVALCFVPYWMGVAIVFYLPPATALSLFLAMILFGRQLMRWTAIDSAVVSFMALVILALMTGYLGLGPAFVAVVEWGSAYLFARIVTTRLSLPWVYALIGSVFIVVAILAIAEYFFSWNPFVALTRPGILYETWGPLQERGGIVRAEGAFGHSIALGCSVAMALPLLLVSPLGRTVRFIGALLLLGATVVTFSRLGIACAVLSLALTFIFLRAEVAKLLRVALLAMVLLGSVLVLPFLGQIFESAGDEAQGSADYRGNLLELVPVMQWFGSSEAMVRSPDGALRFGGYKSIDSTVILGGLTYGIVPMLVLVGLYFAAIALLVGGHATAPLVSVVAQLPALLSVALITQYAAFLWFMVGLAVTAHCVFQQHRKRGDALDGVTLENPARSV